MSIIMSACDIRDKEKVIIKSISWNSGEKQHWLVTGENGSGKSVFVAALAGTLEVVPLEGGLYSNGAAESVALVSFESAAALIEEERRRDDSDFIEGGVDIGRTPRQFIMETIPASESRRFPGGRDLENHPAVALCDISAVLDRGLKYLSTGEIRRTLLCRALASRPSLLILDEPYAGLDAAARTRLCDFLSTDLDGTTVIVVMDRIERLPSSITHVLELSALSVSFSGTLSDYQLIAGNREKSRRDEPQLADESEALDRRLAEVREQGANTLPDSARTNREILVEMKNVTVEWSERKVLDNLSWKLRAGEHWLIRGPNGSGKTTFLELITGDNPQVFRNDVWLFGNKRGSGETIWELKEKMGIVTYRLHTEYRSLGDLPLEAVLLSGLHDSIGLYRQCGEEERSLAEKWLTLTGFEGRGTTLFRDLSYGEQRAVLIARAAIKHPPLLILDEPCHGLDAFHRDRILALLQKIAEHGTSTLLHVTHDETEVLPCERHVLELSPGETPMYRLLTR